MSLLDNPYYDELSKMRFGRRFGGFKGARNTWKNSRKARGKKRDAKYQQWEDNRNREDQDFQDSIKGLSYDEAWDRQQNGPWPKRGGA